MKTILSGLAPSGNLHIGNYLGALKQWVDLQNDYTVFAMVANLHAITVPQDPKVLREKTFEVAKIMVACGIDPERSVVFVQSQVPAHVQLGWILGTLAPVGELERMTQFKEKKEKSGVLAGLLNYPWLMAADILLYQSDAVPVGEDQNQHLEFTRTLARKFNNQFGETFREPKALILKEVARIMGLDDPTKKMSKSAPNPANYVALLDTPDTVRKKIKSAVTDSGKEIKYDPEKKPAISNLMAIFSAFSRKNYEEIEKDYAGKSYVDFKHDLAELLVEKLQPIQERYQSLSDSDIKNILADGAERANAVAADALKEVKKRVGFI